MELYYHQKSKSHIIPYGDRLKINIQRKEVNTESEKANCGFNGNACAHSAADGRRNILIFSYQQNTKRKSSG